eukprot:m.23865 g.23865  ORF g.23865 m.23865 type:complete len:267 (+) comp5589_c1_seq2:58-858(+)
MSDGQPDPVATVQVPPPADELNDESPQQDGSQDGYSREPQQRHQQGPFHHNHRRQGAMLKKTRLCRGFERSGECQYGDNCWFAHGQGELREPQPFMPHRRQHPYVKTKMCKFMQNGGQCPFKEQCNFAHSSMELRPMPAMHQPYMSGPMDYMMRKRPIDSSRYKTRLCKSFSNQGYCKFQDTCAFAHGQVELRAPPQFNGPRADMFNPGFAPFYNDMGNGFQQQQPQFNMYPPQNQQMQQMPQMQQMHQMQQMQQMPPMQNHMAME